MDPTDFPSSHPRRVNLARKSSLIGPKVLRTGIGIRIRAFARIPRDVWIGRCRPEKHDPLPGDGQVYSLYGYLPFRCFGT